MLFQGLYSTSSINGAFTDVRAIPGMCANEPTHASVISWPVPPVFSFKNAHFAQSYCFCFPIVPQSISNELKPREGGGMFYMYITKVQSKKGGLTDTGG